MRIDDLILGPQLGQCCGGRVEVWLERLTRQDLAWLKAASHGARRGIADALETRVTDGLITRKLRLLKDARPVTLRHDGSVQMLLEALQAPRPPLWIFGAGHVGQALVRLLCELASFEIRWIDPRPELFPQGLPEGITTQVSASPASLLGAAPPKTRYLVLTHDHALDYELCLEILTRGDASWLGLIGSASKAARFRSRLRSEGIDAIRLEQLTCPIGVTGIASKVPWAIAIAIAAQLLQHSASATLPKELSADPHPCDGACDSCGTPAR